MEVNTLLDKCSSEHDLESTENISLRLTKLRSQLSSFVKGVSRHERTLATNLYVLMISSEQRNVKPYAIPVQCLSLNESTMRKINAENCLQFAECHERQRIEGSRYVAIHGLGSY